MSVNDEFYEDEYLDPELVTRAELQEFLDFQAEQQQADAEAQEYQAQLAALAQEIDARLDGLGIVDPGQRDAVLAQALVGESDPDGLPDLQTAVGQLRGVIPDLGRPVADALSLDADDATRQAWMIEHARRLNDYEVEQRQVAGEFQPVVAYDLDDDQQRVDAMVAALDEAEAA